MALYIKANRLVAEHCKVDKIRLKLADGNFILWQADMLKFGRLYEITQICEQIGALPLQPWEAKQEQDGIVTRHLPVATDPRFIMPEPEPDSDEITDEVVEEVTEEVAEDVEEATMAEVEADDEPEESEVNDVDE